MMPDFEGFVSFITITPLLVAMTAIAAILISPNIAKWGFQKIESLFGISSSDLKSKLQDAIDRSAAESLFKKRKFENTQRKRSERISRQQDSDKNLFSQALKEVRASRTKKTPAQSQSTEDWIKQYYGD